MNPWKGLKGLPKEMWVIAFAILINRMGTMVLPFLVIYLTANVGLRAGEAGFVITFYGLGALITAPFVGRLADKAGSFFLMKLSLFLTGIILALYPIFQSYSAILFITLIWAIVSEAFRPASLSLTSILVPASGRKTAFALNRLMINLGMSIGPVLAGFLIQYSYSLIFYIDSLTSILSCLFLLAFPVNSVNFHELKEKAVEVKVKAIKDKVFVYFLISFIPSLLVIFQHIGAMPVFLTADLKFATTTIGLLFAVNTVLIIFVEVPLNTAMASWSYRSSLALGAFLLAFGFGAMTFAKDILSVIITIIIWTFGEMIIYPSSSAYISEIAPIEKRGEYMGLFQMVFSLGFTLGPWLGTKVFETFGSRILWTGAFCIGIISSLLMLNIKKKHLNAERISKVQDLKEK